MAQPQHSWASVLMGKPKFVWNLPRDLWDVILQQMPISAIGRVSQVSKWLRDKADRHWHERIVRRGLLPLFESHTSRRIFTDHATGVRNWKEYYIAFLLVERHAQQDPPKFAAESRCSEDKLVFQPDDRELLRQFPSICGGQIINAEATKPYYRTFDLRDREDGSELGIFRLPNGSFAYHRSRRSDMNSYEYHFAQYVSFTAPNFRAFKAAFLIHKEACPFPISFLDWAHHLLDAVDLALSRSMPHYALTNEARHYKGALRLRHARIIKVVFNERSHAFRVMHMDLNRLLKEINNVFRPTDNGYREIRDFDLSLADDTMRDTSLLEDGQVWRARLEKERPKLPRPRRGKKPP